MFIVNEDKPSAKKDVDKVDKETEYSTNRYV